MGGRADDGDTMQSSVAVANGGGGGARGSGRLLAATPAFLSLVPRPRMNGATGNQFVPDAAKRPAKYRDVDMDGTL